MPSKVFVTVFYSNFYFCHEEDLIIFIFISYLLRSDVFVQVWLTHKKRKVQNHNFSWSDKCYEHVCGRHIEMHHSKIVGDWKEFYEQRRTLHGINMPSPLNNCLAMTFSTSFLYTPIDSIDLSSLENLTSLYLQKSSWRGKHWIWFLNYYRRVLTCPYVESELSCILSQAIWPLN